MNTKTEGDTGHILNDVLCELLSLSFDLTFRNLFRIIQKRVAPRPHLQLYISGDIYKVTRDTYPFIFSPQIPTYFKIGLYSDY